MSEESSRPAHRVPKMWTARGWCRETLILSFDFWMGTTRHLVVLKNMLWSLWWTGSWQAGAAGAFPATVADPSTVFLTFFSRGQRPLRLYWSRSHVSFTAQLWHIPVQCVTRPSLMLELRNQYDQLDIPPSTLQLVFWTYFATDRLVQFFMSSVYRLLDRLTPQW